MEEKKNEEGKHSFAPFWWILFFPFIFLLLLFIAIVCFSFRVSSSIVSTPVRYTQKEKEAIEENSFQSCYEVNYDNLLNKKETVSTTFSSSYQDFAYKVYAPFLEEEKNSSYSPLGLYSSLHLASLASDASGEREFERVLSSTKEERNENYLRMVSFNHGESERGISKLYSSVFFDSQRGETPSASYLEELKENDCEAYTFDGSSSVDRNKVVTYLNDRSQDTSLYKEEDIPSTPSSNDSLGLLLLSSFDFKKNWSIPFSSSETKKDTFLDPNGKSTALPFMQHTVLSTYYEYEDYLSVYDYLADGYSLQYVIPKDKNQVLKDVLEGKNYFQENEENKKEGYISLSVPKFTSASSLSFHDVLNSLGMKKVFSDKENCFSFAYQNSKDNKNYYLYELKQKNESCFQEDGKSEHRLVARKGVIEDGVISENTSYGSPDSTTTEKVTDIKLDHSFLYVLYDEEKMPVYMGQFVGLE